MGGGYEHGVQALQRQCAGHWHVELAGKRFLPGAEFDHERDGDDLQRKDDGGYGAGAGLWDGVVNGVDGGGGVDDVVRECDVRGGTVCGELLFGLDGQLYDRGERGGFADDWMDG